MEGRLAGTCMLVGGDSLHETGRVGVAAAGGRSPGASQVHAAAAAGSRDENS